jgi:3-hydroxyacyl-CoA dehydrogenase
MVAGGAFPRWEGGPMFWAARRGLLVLRADIRRWGETAPAQWQVAPLIDALIRNGRSFADLDAA